MFDDGKLDLDLAALAVPLAGKLDETGSPWKPYRLLDPSGEPVRAAAEFFVDLQARGRSQATVRSYGMDLLRWFCACCCLLTGPAAAIVGVVRSICFSSWWRMQTGARGR